MFFKTAISVDCHIGFFWGDIPRDNRDVAFIVAR